MMMMMAVVVVVVLVTVMIRMMLSRFHSEIYMHSFLATSALKHPMFCIELRRFTEI